MPSKEISLVVKPIRENWENIKKDYALAVPGKHLVITCSLRSVEEQMKLYEQGRKLGSDKKWYIVDKAKIVTNVDGATVCGAHNFSPARAIDVMIVDDTTGKETWMEKLYLPIGPIVRKYGLTWGGDWKSIKDLPHIEVASYKTYQGD